jgi:large repetitive protein
VPCGSSADPSITGNPTVSDNCTPTAQITVTFSDQTSDGQIARTWTATDQAGNAASCTQTITFVDEQAPVISCPPATTVPCGSSADPSITGNPTVSDNCTPTAQITVTFSDQTSDGQIMRTWTATDQAGNAASCTQTITFVDEQAPVISCPPATTVPCGSSADPS